MNCSIVFHIIPGNGIFIIPDRHILLFLYSYSTLILFHSIPAIPQVLRQVPHPAVDQLCCAAGLRRGAGRTGFHPTAAGAADAETTAGTKRGNVVHQH